MPKTRSERRLDYIYRTADKALGLLSGALAIAIVPVILGYLIGGVAGLVIGLLVALVWAVMAPYWIVEWHARASARWEDVE